MTQAPPFRVTVYDKTLQRLGMVGDPAAVRVVARHNAPSAAELTVRSDHRLLPALLTAGARVRVDYDGGFLLSGPVRDVAGQGPAAEGTITFQIEDDWRVLASVLGWPVPGSALDSQTVAYDTRTGPAETVLKDFVTANAVTRLGRPIIVPATQGRGATITVSMRMHALADRLYPALDQAGIGVTVQQAGPAQQGTGLALDVYEPAVYPRPLTEASGVVQAWAWSRTAPGATRVVAGDQGEAEARSFTTTADTPREAAWGDVIERFIDARDTDDPAEVTQRRAEFLAEHDVRYGLALTLAETQHFRYDPTGAAGVRVGDQVTVEVGPGITVTDVLREAVLSWTAEDGVQVTPVIGERRDDPRSIFARELATVRRDVRRIQSL